MSELISVVGGVGASGGVGEVGDAELDGLGAAGADLVHLGEFGVGAGEADFEAFGFTEPVLGLGLSDAGDEVVPDLDETVRAAGSGRRSGQRRQLCSWMQGVS